MDRVFIMNLIKKLVPTFGLGINYTFAKNIKARLSYKIIKYKVNEND